MTCLHLPARDVPKNVFAAMEPSPEPVKSCLAWPLPNRLLKDEEGRAGRAQVTDIP